MTYTIEEQAWARPGDGVALADLRAELVAQGHTILEMDMNNNRVHFLRVTAVTK